MTLTKLAPGECRWTQLMISQHREDGTRAEIHPDLCRHMTSLGHNRLILIETAHCCTLKNKSYHDANFVVASGTVGHQPPVLPLTTKWAL